jgi:hypothetical protein
MSRPASLSDELVMIGSTASFQLRDHPNFRVRGVAYFRVWGLPASLARDLDVITAQGSGIRPQAQERAEIGACLLLAGARRRSRYN